ncbi:MAG: hypothetical protein QXT10_03325 [Candidatus Bathyarchaeia archaeon]
MSTRLETSLSELKSWLEGQTEHLLAPIQVKAEKLLGEMRKAHGELIEACKMLVESSRREIERRNMRTFKRAQALNKLVRNWNFSLLHNGSWKIPAGF